MPVEVAGAAGTEATAVVVVDEEVVVITPIPVTPTKTTDRIRVRIKINKIHLPSLTRRAPSIQICPPVLAGPVRSTGRKDEGHLIVVTLWSASGSRL